MALPMRRWPDQAHYVQGKLRQTVDDLATGQDRIIERLRNVCVTHLAMIGEADFPEALAPTWRSIHARFTSGTSRGSEGKINRTLDDMSEDEAAELALQIVELWRDYKEAIPQGG